MTLEELFDLYFSDDLNANEVKKLGLTATPTLQEMAVLWGFNKACELLDEDPKEVLKREEEEYDL